MENQEIKEEKKGGGKRLLVFILIVLLISNGVTGWLYFQEMERKNTVIIEKTAIFKERDNVKNDLLELQKNYAELQTNDVKVQAELEEKRALIADLLEQAEKHKGDAYIIARLRKETETLKKIMKHYVHEIDSLGRLNQTLVADKKKISEDLSSEQTKTAQLSKEKDDLKNVVAIGSALKAGGIKAVAVRYKSGGKKESETNKAKRVEKIKVTFSLAENPIAKAGNHDIYLRVVSPDGKELVKSQDADHMFKFGGNKGFFAAKKGISYNNEETQVTIYTDVPPTFVAGKYLIDISTDDVVIGQATVTLE